MIKLRPPWKWCSRRTDHFTPPKRVVDDGEAVIPVDFVADSEANIPVGSVGDTETAIPVDSVSHSEAVIPVEHTGINPGTYEAVVKAPMDDTQPKFKALKNVVADLTGAKKATQEGHLIRISFVIDATELPNLIEKLRKYDLISFNEKKEEVKSKAVKDALGECAGLEDDKVNSIPAMSGSGAKDAGNPNVPFPNKLRSSSSQNIVMSETFETSESGSEIGTMKNDLVQNEVQPSNQDVVLSEEATFTSIETLPSHLKKCLLYTSLFPQNYAFEKGTLINLWIAAGYIVHEETKPMEDSAGYMVHEKTKLMEDTGCQYFDKLSNFYCKSSDEPSSYSVNDDVYNSLQKCADGDYVILVDDKGKAQHISVHGERVDLVNFKTFDETRDLESLLLLHEKNKHITQIPDSIFLKYSSLRVLDLSHTGIRDLPSSVGNLKVLCYLDLSETCIRWLPQSVTTLSKLQVLKLRGCLNFIELPKDTKDMITLRHLDLDINRQLTSMPAEMGKLTNLQTMSAFIVGQDTDCGIAQLKKMNNLKASLTITKLENVGLHDAEEAKLCNKMYLHRLVLQWSMLCKATEHVLEALKPHKNLEVLEIICYGGLTCPTWLEEQYFLKLTSVFLYNWRNCDLPPLGRLPHLTSLQVGEMYAVKEVNQLFCGGGTTKGFPRLETLHLYGMPYLVKWTGVEEGEMPCLKKLIIADCPKLIELPNLSHLKALQHLEISFCTKLPLLTEQVLPASVQRLDINDCPILEQWCRKEEDWQKIQAVDNIWINYEDISQS